MSYGKIKDCLGNMNDKAFNFALHMLFKDILPEQFLFYTSFWFTICKKLLKLTQEQTIRKTLNWSKLNVTNAKKKKKTIKTHFKRSSSELVAPFITVCKKQWTKNKSTTYEAMNFFDVLPRQYSYWLRLDEMFVIAIILPNLWLIFCKQREKLDKKKKLEVTYMFSIPLFIEYKSKVTLTIRCKFAFDTIFIVFSGFHIYSMIYTCIPFVCGTKWNCYRIS